MACSNVTFFVNHPVVKLEILWNSMAAKEGFFLLVEGRGKKRIIFALCMLQQSGADGGGGVGSQGAWE